MKGEIPESIWLFSLGVFVLFCFSPKRVKYKNGFLLSVVLTASFFRDVKPRGCSVPERQGMGDQTYFSRYKLIWTVLSLNTCGILWQALAKFCPEMGCTGASCECGQEPPCVAVPIVRKGFPGKSLVEVTSVHVFSFCPACRRGHGLG